MKIGGLGRVGAAALVACLLVGCGKPEASAASPPKDIQALLDKYGSAASAPAAVVSGSSAERFQLTAPANGPNVWKIDRRTGEVWLCAFSATGPICTPARQDLPS